MDTDGCILSACLALIFSLLKGCSTACETAVTEISDSELKTLSEGDTRYEKLYKLTTNPSKMLLTFSANRILLSCAIAVCICVSLFNAVNAFFDSFAEKNTSVFLTLLVIILASGFVISVLTDSFPRALAEKTEKSFAVSSARFVSFLVVMYYPLTLLNSSLDRAARNLLGLSSKKKNEVVTEEKILLMLEAGNETGVIEPSEKEMINNIFDFDDISVSEIMKHRTELVAVDADTPVTDVVRLAIDEGFSRIPVYEGTVDSICGMIYVKDLLGLIINDRDLNATVRRFMRDVFFVPETNTCAEVFEALTQSKSHIAVVVDEYGGTAGMVTMEDLVEEIVGNIQDEYDNEESDILKEADGVYTVSGSADPEDILPALGAELPEHNQYDTMSALYVDLLGRIPDENDITPVMFENIELMPLSTEDNWVSKIRAVVKSKPGGDIAE